MATFQIVSYKVDGKKLSNKRLEIGGVEDMASARWALDLERSSVARSGAIGGVTEIVNDEFNVEDFSGEVCRVYKIEQV